MNLETLIKCMSSISREEFDTRCENGKTLQENAGARKCQYVYWLKRPYLESRAARFETNLNKETTYYVISSTQSINSSTTTTKAKLQQLEMTPRQIAERDPKREIKTRSWNISMFGLHISSTHSPHLDLITLIMMLKAIAEKMALEITMAFLTFGLVHTRRRITIHGYQHVHMGRYQKEPDNQA